ncbi:TonB-dependent receptor [Pseudomaricurvus alkylphenolicus]|uniref:TonB-dependent receptor n=1 Tax=Pseudomaricurvus alkylphenolicus TaxID=1306991 RepID=UPI0014220510|nr:TonB-dependent receptor [Pseudomaricurvus alkylphenolicus]NIB40495.1 TonB-dependent receptor [Pseudomaricurvus alkylphenolicus]
MNAFALKALPLTCAIALVGTSTQAIGQYTLEEIVVTAQKRTQTLQEVPVAVSVVSGDNMTKNNLTDLNVLAAKVPTVKIAPTAVGELINIRGFGSGNNVAFEQAVSTFVDGSYRSRAISRRLAMFDLERVEVLKGPQLTYFGANATAGAFSLTTRKSNPGDDSQANVNLYYEPEYGDYNIDVGASLAVTEQLSVRLAGRLFGSDGYSENQTSGQEGPSNDDHSVRASFAWEPTDSYRMDFRWDNGELDVSEAVPSEIVSCASPEGGLPSSLLCQGFLALGGEDRIDYNSYGTSAFFKAEFDEIEWSNRWELESGGAITAVSSFYTHESERLADPMPVNLPNSLGLEGGFLPAYVGEEFDQFSQEIRFETSIGDQIDLMVGAYYLNSDLELENGVAFNFVTPELLGPLGALWIPGSGYALNTDQEQELKSVFAAVDIQLSDAALLSLGLRYSEVEKEASRINIPVVWSDNVPTLDSAVPLEAVYGTLPIPYPVVIPLPGLAPITNDAELAGFIQGAVIGGSPAQFADTTHKDSGFMPSVNFSYDITPDVMAYAKFSRGFKSGGFGFSNIPETFDKEEVTAYEVGMKATLLDGAMFVSLAAFSNEYDDLQESGNTVSPTGAVVTFVDNVGKAKSEGVEMAVTWRASERVTLSADVAWLDAIYDEWVDAPCDEVNKALGTCDDNVAQTNDLSGENRPFSPEWSGTLSVNYEMPLGEGLLSIEPSVDFSSGYDTLATLEPISYQPGYEKLNLRIGYESAAGDWTIALIGKNLNDEVTSDFRQLLPTSPGSGSLVPNPPKTIAIQFGMNFQ